MKNNTFSRHSLSHFHQRKSWRKSMFSGIRSLLTSKKGILVVFFTLAIFFFIWVASILGTWRTFFWNIPELTGIFSQKTYLLLLHNEHELRPTGGFITGAAIVKVRGTFPEITFINSEEVTIPNPQIQAPEAISSVLTRDPKYAGWVFRDSNFSLDFHENAQKALEFLQWDERFQRTEFDGVVGIDTMFLEDVVGMFGPFEKDGKTITAGNLFEVLQLSAKNFDHHDLEAWKNRKTAFAPLAHDLISQILSTPSLWEKLFAILAENASEKHILFSFSDEDIQKKFREKGWTGELPSEPFWTINFANLGGRKADRFMRKSFHSSLHVEEKGTIAETLSILLSHQGTYNLQSDRYEAFVRIVRPQGTKMNAYTGDFETQPQESEREYGDEISFFVVLNPGEEKLFTFTLTLPESETFVSADTLEIPLVKQAGTESLNWNFTIRAENDPRFTVEGCDEGRSRENVFFCDLKLRSDTFLNIQKHPDLTPPLLQFANFTGVNTAEIRFSEDILPEISVEDIRLFDEQEGQTSRVSLEKVTIKGENILLQFSGVPSTAGKRWRLEIPNLQDISGNMFEGETEGYFATTMVR